MAWRTSEAATLRSGTCHQVAVRGGGTQARACACVRVCVCVCVCAAVHIIITLPGTFFLTDTEVCGIPVWSVHAVWPWPVKTFKYNVNVSIQVHI